MDFQKNMSNSSTQQDNSKIDIISPELILLKVTFFVLLEIFGNFLLISMILYEKYGIDPKKRTVNNQLLSSICWIIILFNMSIMPSYFYCGIFPTLCKHFDNRS